MARQKMTSKKRMTPAQKYERLDRRYSDFTAGAISIHNAWLAVFDRADQSLVNHHSLHPKAEQALLFRGDAGDSVTGSFNGSLHGSGIHAIFADDFGNAFFMGSSDAFDRETVLDGLVDSRFTFGASHALNIQYNFNHKDYLLHSS